MNILKNTKILYIIATLAGLKIGDVMYKHKNKKSLNKEWVVVDIHDDFIKIISR